METMTEDGFKVLKRRIEAPTLRRLYKDGKLPLTMKLIKIELCARECYLTGSEGEYICTESGNLIPKLQELKLPKAIIIDMCGNSFDLEEMEMK